VPAKIAGSTVWSCTSHDPGGSRAGRWEAVVWRPAGTCTRVRGSGIWPHDWPDTCDEKRRTAGTWTTCALLPASGRCGSGGGPTAWSAGRMPGSRREPGRPSPGRVSDPRTAGAHRTSPRFAPGRVCSGVGACRVPISYSTSKTDSLDRLLERPAPPARRPAFDPPGEAAYTPSVSARPSVISGQPKRQPRDGSRSAPSGGVTGGLACCTLTAES